MKPSCVIESSESDNSKPLSNPPADISDRSEPKGTTKRKSSSSPPSASSDDDTVNQSKRPKRSVDVMKAFLGDVLQKREEAVERRHKENIEAVNSLIGVLKDTLKK
ncbi:hypothetical protein DPMN_174160 [Dreissena polymorpha]|uniref:Uncharacterized protein n=2 Tax=Dreissena polymorpha TaxID=45954 RepID=A0A9D4E4W3_DREPO|nr:hypothetical protein DPMN_174160 [Dreissena polymorpha]